MKPINLKELTGKSERFTSAPEVDLLPFRPRGSGDDPASEGTHYGHTVSGDSGGDDGSDRGILLVDEGQLSAMRPIRCSSSVDGDMVAFHGERDKRRGQWSGGDGGGEGGDVDGGGSGEDWP